MQRFLRSLSFLALVFARPSPAAAEPWKAIPFTLRDLSGTPHALADYKGKVVVLEFFASWCSSCAASVKGLNLLAKQYPAHVVVVAVSTSEDDPQGLPGFVKELKPEYTVLVDDTDRVGRQYRVVAFPSYFVIDPKGIVRASQEGSVEWSDPRNLKRLESMFDGSDVPGEVPVETPMPVTTVSLAPDLR